MALINLEVTQEYLNDHPECTAAIGDIIPVETDTLPAPLQATNSHLDGEIKLPSGATATVVKFSGHHVLDIIAASTTGDNKDRSLDDELIWQLIAMTAIYNGRPLTVAAMDDMDGADLMELMSLFGKQMNSEANQDNLPTDAKEGFRYKRLPNGSLAYIEKYKGRHIKETQKQMKKDGSDFFTVLISRMITIDGADIFPEDISAMDGLTVFALFGEVSAAMFPQG